MKVDTDMIVYDAAVITLFSLIGGFCVHAVCSGAWWHIGTAVVSGIVILAHYKELRKILKRK
jgi:hypothetical protein